MSKKNWKFLLITCGILIIHELYKNYFLVFDADFTQCARPSKAVGAISVSMVGTSEFCPKIIWTIDQCLTQICMIQCINRSLLLVKNSHKKVFDTKV